MGGGSRPSSLVVEQLRCQRCGSAGQLRHAPSPAPMSGIWCEACHQRLRRHQRRLHGAIRLVPFLTIAIGVLLVFIRRSY